MRLRCPPLPLLTLPLPQIFEALHNSSSSGGTFRVQCMRSPPAWGKPYRVQVSETVVTDPTLVVYADVLVATDASCARITTVRRPDSGPLSSPEEVASDSDRVVWTTHLNKGRMSRLERLVKRWDGCVSVSLWLCSEEDWEFVSAVHAQNPEINKHVTFHVVLGYGGYPYNLQRNVALTPFAPWASGGEFASPWVLVADADGVPSVGERVMSKVR